jgi:hypothetical protein
MEQLSKTCKILYDKDYLDNMKQLNDKNIYKKVYYDSFMEYETLRDEFKKKLPILIREHKIDDWLYYDWHSENHEFGIKWSNRIYEELQPILSKLTKNQNNTWVVHISKIFEFSIRGLAKSISFIQDEDLQEPFYNKDVCNVMITNMINRILFESGEFASIEAGGEDNFEMSKLRCFICKKCKKEVDVLCVYLNEYDEICYDCDSNNN